LSEANTTMGILLQVERADDVEHLADDGITLHE
jgi:hypothetical protein